MKTITLELPDETTCVGLFVNYKRKETTVSEETGIKIISTMITTTNALLNAEKYDTVKIEDGNVYYYNK